MNLQVGGDCPKCRMPIGGCDCEPADKPKARIGEVMSGIRIHPDGSITSIPREILMELQAFRIMVDELKRAGEKAIESGGGVVASNPLLWDEAFGRRIPIGMEFNFRVIYYGGKPKA